MPCTSQRCRQRESKIRVVVRQRMAAVQSGSTIWQHNLVVQSGSTIWRCNLACCGLLFAVQANTFLDKFFFGASQMRSPKGVVDMRSPKGTFERLMIDYNGGDLWRPLGTEDLISTLWCVIPVRLSVSYCSLLSLLWWCAILSHVWSAAIQYG